MAGALAIDGGVAVQNVPYKPLRERPLNHGQALEYAATPPRAQWPESS
jgi:hypothetical protein